MAMYRTFTDSEEAARDAAITERIENECEGCTSTYGTDGYETWSPAQHCPVHGEHTRAWWDDLNRWLDQRWPGTWHAGTEERQAS